jgi:hypothetical protein
MRRGPETVDAEIGTFACLARDRLAVSTIADEARTEDRSELGCGAVERQRQTKPRIGEHLLCVPAVARIAGETRVRAEVFLTPAAVVADSAGAGEPRHADPVADPKSVDERPVRADDPDDLVTRRDGVAKTVELRIHHVQVRAADTARLDIDQHFVRGGLGQLQLHRLER